MTQNIYDDAEFFERYSQLPRSVAGLALIAASAVLLSADNALPGAWSLIPTGGPRC